MLTLRVCRSIHDGHVLEGARVEVNESCARIVHLVNLFRTRERHAAWHIPYTAWHWVL